MKIALIYLRHAPTCGYNWFYISRYYVGLIRVRDITDSELSVKADSHTARRRTLCEWTFTLEAAVFLTVYFAAKFADDAAVVRAVSCCFVSGVLYWCVSTKKVYVKPFNASCSKLLLFEGLSPPFLIFDIRALWRSVVSARAPECQKLKMVG